jgi:hypothetical protein
MLSLRLVGVSLLRYEDRRLPGSLLIHEPPRSVGRANRFIPPAVISKLVLPPGQSCIFTKKFSALRAEEKREKGSKSKGSTEPT